MGNKGGARNPGKWLGIRLPFAKAQDWPGCPLLC